MQTEKCWERFQVLPARHLLSKRMRCNITAAVCPQGGLPRLHIPGTGLAVDRPAEPQMPERPKTPCQTANHCPRAACLPHDFIVGGVDVGGVVPHATYFLVCGEMDPEAGLNVVRWPLPAGHRSSDKFQQKHAQIEQLLGSPRLARDESSVSFCFLLSQPQPSHLQYIDCLYQIRRPRISRHQDLTDIATPELSTRVPSSDTPHLSSILLDTIYNLQHWPPGLDAAGSPGGPDLPTTTT